MVTCYKLERNKSSLDYWGVTHYELQKGILSSVLEYMFTKKVLMFTMLLPWNSSKIQKCKLSGGLNQNTSHHDSVKTFYMIQYLKCM